MSARAKRSNLETSGPRFKYEDFVPFYGSRAKCADAPVTAHFEANCFSPEAALDVYV